MKKLLYISFVLGALFLTASCERQLTVYEAEEGEVCASFLADEAVVSMVAADGNKFTVDLYRGLSQGAATVPFTFTDATGLFTPAKTQFDFADGEVKASVDITYADINALEYGTEYEMSIKINDATQVSVAGYDKITVTASRPATRVSKGTGVWQCALSSSPWPQPLFNLAEDNNFYILPDLYTEGYDVTFKYAGGTPVFAADINTFMMYDEDTPAYGTFHIYPAAVSVTAGVMEIVAEYALPAISYSFGVYAEYFQLPEGFSF